MEHAAQRRTSRIGIIAVNGRCLIVVWGGNNGALGWRRVAATGHVYVTARALCYPLPCDRGRCVAAYAWLRACGPHAKVLTEEEAETIGISADVWWSALLGTGLSARIS